MRVSAAREGTTRRDAERALRARLTDVEREGYRKPEPLTFAAFAERFVAEHLPARNLSKSTLVAYGISIRHLVRELGSVRLSELERRPELVERFVAARLAGGSSPKTVRNDLTLLGRMFRVARKWRLAKENPVDLIDPPRDEESETELLLPGEIAAVLAAFRELEAEEMPTCAIGTPSAAVR